MKRLWFIGFLLVAVLSCGQTVDQKYLIEPEQLSLVLKETDSIQLIDVRTPKEYQMRHIKGAVNYNFFDEDFANRISKLNKKQAVYVYCRSGKRSGKSISEFKKLGFEKIYSLEGGIKNWVEKGFKTTP